MEHFYQKIHGWFTYDNFYREICQQLPVNGKFVEVGAWMGQSIAFMGVEAINANKGLKLWAIDNFLGDYMHVDFEDVKNGTLYATFLKNINPVLSVVTPIKADSAESANLFEDNSLDCVFIDACHEYEFVKKDVLAWLPKVKVGGIICGHDYMWCKERPDGPPVKRAVDEIFGVENVGFRNIHENCWIVTKK